MTKTRRRFPESFKRVTVKSVLTSTALRRVADTLGIAESLLNRSVSSSSKAALPSLARANSAAGERSCAVSATTMERNALRKALTMFSAPSRR